MSEHLPFLATRNLFLINTLLPFVTRLLHPGSRELYGNLEEGHWLQAEGGRSGWL